MEKLDNYIDFLATKAWSSPCKGIDIDTGLGQYLFDFQRDIVIWALRRGRACLFEECGLGKTIQQLEWAKHIPGNVLIVAPLAVTEQTKLEGAKFGIHCEVSKNGQRKGKITITNYERLHLFRSNDYQGIVLDESSIIKSYTGKYRNFVIDEFYNIPYKLCCTATPAPNDIMELANHTEFMGLMKRQEFLATWFAHDGGNTSQWRLKRHAEKPFWEWVATWAIVLRTPGDLGYDDSRFELPPLVMHQHNVVTNTVVDGLLFALPAQTLAEQRVARRTTMDARLAKAVHITRDGGPWVIWCELNDESTLLARKISDAVELVGSDSAEVKAEKLLSFYQGHIRVLITKPKIAAHGLNWQHCSNQCFVGLSHSFEQTYQAIRRSWRFGQVHPVDVHVISTDIESAVVDNIERKKVAHERMIMNMANTMRDVTISELRGSTRISEDYSTNARTGKGWKMILGDSVTETKNVADNSVGISIFSPPFASLYTYSASDRDMGNCRDYNEFMGHFKYLIMELNRITIPGRLVCVHCMDLPIVKEREGFIGIRDFPGIITRVFEQYDMHLHSRTVIWKDPVTAMQRTKAIGLLWKQLKKDSTFSRMGLPDYVLTFKKKGANPYPVRHGAEDFPVGQWQQWASPVWMDIDPYDTLQRLSARDDKDERHIAPLQLEVIRRCLVLWSNPGDVVFSPFAGIGSEGYVALQNDRKFFGIELKESYYKQACNNLENVVRQGVLF